jgi:hypothetical protein
MKRFDLTFRSIGVSIKTVEINQLIITLLGNISPLSEVTED